jgi:hypothetical protein
MLIISQYPDCVKERDAENKTPLHIVCSYSGYVTLAEKSITTYPAALKQFDDQHNLLLHLVCSHVCSESIIRKLLMVYPNALQYPDSNGDPFHFSSFLL